MHFDNTAIIVADGARARIFTVDHTDQDRPKLEERTTLVHPEHRVPGHELHESPRASAHGGTPGRPHIYDDHRQAHREDSDRRFAALLQPEADKLIRDLGVARIVVVAEPRVLGRVRAALTSVATHARIEEVPHDIAGQSAHQIARYLTDYSVL